jgi:hypothetical protein
MAIPSRLSKTTLGDVLGELTRQEVTGTLELHESTAARTYIHQIMLRDGHIVRVVSPRGRRLAEYLGEGQDSSAEPEAGLIGERLLARGVVSPERLQEALSAQRRERLEALFQLEEAELRFRPRAPSPLPQDPAPLRTIPLLQGRARRRDRFQSETPRARALRTLGLGAAATPVEIRRAFRVLARELHPDAHPELSKDARQRCLDKFSELSRAYHKLIA